MKTVIHSLILTTGLLVSACDKPSTTENPSSHEGVGNVFEELRKTPNFERHAEIFLSSDSWRFERNTYKSEEPKISVKTLGKGHFRFHVECGYIAQDDIYKITMTDGGKSGFAKVLDLVSRKGTRIVTYSDFEVRHGPMNWGRFPDRIEWNWGEKLKKSGVDLFEYREDICSTAESLEINEDGTASALPDYYIRGTADYDRALKQYPEIARSEAERIEALDQLGREQLEMMKDKKKLDEELREHFKSFYGQ